MLIGRRGQPAVGTSGTDFDADIGLTLWGDESRSDPQVLMPSAHAFGGDFWGRLPAQVSIPNTGYRRGFDAGPLQVGAGSVSLGWFRGFWSFPLGFLPAFLPCRLYF